MWTTAAMRQQVDVQPPPPLPTLNLQPLLLSTRSSHLWFCSLSQMPRTISSLSPELHPARAAGKWISAAPSPPPRHLSLSQFVSVCSLLARHSCVYVKAAACECSLLLLLRFPLHCPASSVATLAVGPAVHLLRSGNAQVVKAALQMLDHLLGHSRLLCAMLRCGCCVR